MEERLTSKIALVPSGCWIWLGATRNTPHGARYGQIRRNKKLLAAHIEIYKVLVGEIPKDKELDHLCRNTLCVNPKHLEAVTHQVNILRGVSPTAVNARKTHCPLGHKFTPRKGGRICRTCANRANRAYRARMKAA
jgi:hypothetical protein